MTGVTWTPVPEEKRENVAWLLERIKESTPDVVVLSGWANPAYRALPLNAADRPIRYVLAMDTPWRGTVKQWLAPFALANYLQRIDAVFVPGERGWQYAKRLGFSEERIYRGLYGVDWDFFSAAAAIRSTAPSWPRQFLFVGRYADVKGIPLLMRAYADYRRSVPDPWPLVCCGRGPLAAFLTAQPGVTDKGFLQPAGVRDEMARSGALVLPSLFDPWPLTVVEACAAALPVVCTEVCGSSVEVIREGYSGFTIPTGNHDRLVDGLIRIHTSPDLHAMGDRAKTLAAAYSAGEWSQRWRAALRRILILK